MLVVPTEVRIKYAEFLDKKGIAQKYIYKCQKYLRQYLDFCQKYRYEPATDQGIKAFPQKLTKKRPYIPVVLSRAEIDTIFRAIDEQYLLIVKLLYGCGLRLFECLSLRVHCLNLEDGILTVHNGKGKKDRTVPLPKSLHGELYQQLDAVHTLHNKDVAKGYGGVFLFDAYERKSKNASRQFIWQWVFPAHKLSRVKETGEMKRFHVHESHVQKALLRAVEKA